MSSINTNPNTFTGFDPAALHTDLEQVRETAAQSITKALTMLMTLDATGALPAGQEGAMALSPPKSLLTNVADLTLRIGLLQDALNELMQQVSKNEIEGRLNDLKRENTEQLEKIEKQMKEIEESVKKQAEAEKKSNIFDAIGKWFSAIFDFVSAIFTAIAAVGYALSGNVVAAAGLFVASAALFASGICNTVLAIDATVKAAGGDGFLSDQAKANLAKAAEICGYIAMGASLISGMAVVVQGVRAGAAMAGKALAKEGLEAGRKAVMKEVMAAGRDAMKELMKMGTREMLDDVAKMGVRNMVIQVMKSILRPLAELSLRMGVVSVLTQAPGKITQGVGDLKVADLRLEAAKDMKEAEEAEAAAKAIQATIEMLRKLIEQLQSDLEDMLEASMETVSAIFNAADESSESMKELMHFQSA